MSDGRCRACCWAFWWSSDERRAWATRFRVSESNQTSALVHLVWKLFLFAYAFGVDIVNVGQNWGGARQSRYLSYLTMGCCLSSSTEALVAYGSGGLCEEECCIRDDRHRCAPARPLQWGLWLVAITLGLSATAAAIVYLYPGWPARVKAWSSSSTPPATAAEAALFHWWRVHTFFIYVTFSVAVPFQMVIVPVYWIALYNPSSYINTFDVWQNVESHGIKLVLIMLDLLTNSMTLPSSHVLFTLAFAGAYILTNYLVTSETGEPVYGILTWRNSAFAAGFCLAVLAAAIGAFFVAHMIAVARDRITFRCRKVSHPMVDPKDALAVAFQDAHPYHFTDDARSLCDCAFCCAACNHCAVPEKDPEIVDELPPTSTAVAPSIQVASVARPA